MPVLPEETTIKIDGQYFVRRQLPLVIARATSIYKAHGRSVDSLVYALQKSFGSDPDQAYVALSRVTRLEGLHDIKNDSDPKLQSDSKLIDVNKSLFTANNDKLTAVDRDMNRLRGLTTLKVLDSY